MKKRFISLALCLLMIVTTFASTSCAREDDGDDGMLSIEGNSSNAMTISIWGIKGEGTTDEAIAEVEDAMSKYTETKYNTAIELVLYPEDEYKDAVMGRMAEIQEKIELEKAEAAARKKAEREAKKRGETLATEAPKETEPVDTEDETVLDEFGLPTTLYPKVEDDQLDIFLITDYEMLIACNDAEYLSRLDDEVANSSKIISTYVHPTIVKAGTVNGSIVAIPNQKLIGEYTYMLVNRVLLDKYYYDIDDIKTLEDTYNFLLDVVREEPEYEALVGDISPININYFSPDGTKTVFGNMLKADAEFGDDFKPKFLFEIPNWKNYIKFYNRIKTSNCIGSETFTPEDKFGVGIMKGTAEDLEAYNDNYHAIVLQAPQGTVDNLYDGLFAVSSFTKNLARSMEILTCLNTKAEFRNLFGYGIEGVHYTIDDDGAIDIISDEYNMKLEYTGNCFIAHAPEGNTPDYWDASKKHNLDLALSPYLGFSITADGIETDMYEYAVEFSNQFYADLDKATSEAEVNRLINDYWERCENDEILVNWVNDMPPAETEGGTPPNTAGSVYFKWSLFN